MQQSSVLIDGGCCLCTAVAAGVVEIERGDTMFAEGAGEEGAAVHRFGGVISHFSTLLLLAGAGLSIRCATLGRTRVASRPSNA
jgi:hypothetical protein